MKERCRPWRPNIIKTVASDARNIVMSELRCLGIWPDRAEHLRLLRLRDKRYAALSEQLLPSCLGADTHLFLRRSHDGHPLTFGYEVALAFSAIKRWHIVEHRGAAVSALLNLLFVMVDYQCDQVPTRGGALLQVLDKHTLLELLEYPEAASSFRSRSESVEDVEVRILMKVAAEVFERLHQIRSLGTESAPEWLILTDWLSRSFDAQIHTIGPPSARDVKLKSTAPSQIFISAMRLARPMPQSAETEIERRFSSALARALWLIDDLADLEEDALAGSANSILLAAEASGVPRRRALQEHMRSACEKTVASLKTVSDILLLCEVEAAPRLERSMMSYIRSWLT